MEKNQELQQRKVLFLISLPQTPEFEHDREDVSLCMDELRGLHVEVREHIWREDLAEANAFDIVIVVAHLVDGTFVLADGTMSVNEFAESLPEDFGGVVDISSCNSVTAKEAVERRCPACIVQAALTTVPLMRRIIMYPDVVRHLGESPTMSYKEVYQKISNLFDSLIDEMIDDAQGDDGGKDDAQVEEAVKLGTTATIGAPFEVERGVPFLLVVVLHTDTNKGLEMGVNVIEQTFGKKLTRDQFDLGETYSLKTKNNVYVELDFVPKVMKYYIDVDRKENERLKLKWRGRMSFAKLILTLKDSTPLKHKAFTVKIKLMRSEDSPIMEGLAQFRADESTAVTSKKTDVDVPKEPVKNLADKGLNTFLKKYFYTQIEFIIGRQLANEDVIGEGVKMLFDPMEDGKTDKKEPTMEQLPELLTSYDRDEIESKEAKKIYKQHNRIVAMQRELNKEIDILKEMLCDFNNQEVDMVTAKKEEIGRRILELAQLMRQYQGNLRFVTDMIHLKSYIKSNMKNKTDGAKNHLDVIESRIDGLTSHIDDSPDASLFKSLGLNITRGSRATIRGSFLMLGMAVGNYIYEEDKSGLKHLNIAKYYKWSSYKNDKTRRNKINEINRDVERLKLPQNEAIIDEYVQQGSIVASCLKKMTIRIDKKGSTRNCVDYSICM